MIKKLTSRKFIVTVIAAIAGIVTLCGADREVVMVIAGAAMTIVPSVVYCLMEGVLDAKSIRNITEVVADTGEKLGASEDTVNVIKQVGAVGELLADEDFDE